MTLLLGRNQHHDPVPGPAAAPPLDRDHVRRPGLGDHHRTARTVHLIHFVRRRVLEPGCAFCRDLLAYTVVSEGAKLGEVRMVRLADGHPSDWHNGVDWEAVLPDETRVSGRYGALDRGPGEVFVNRRRAADALAAVSRGSG